MIITLHPLFFGGCVNLSVIVLDLGIFRWELHSLRKSLGPKQSPFKFTQWPQKDGVQLLLSKYSVSVLPKTLVPVLHKTHIPSFGT